MHLVVDWFFQALGNWQGWLSGGGVGGLVVIAIGIAERFAEWKMPKRWYATVVLAGFFCGANFVAWSSAFQSMKGREADFRIANGEATKCRNESSSLRSELDDIRKSVPPEPANSLRRRARRLADDIDQFWAERNESHPPRSNGHADATGEQAEVNKKSDAYDGETNRICLSRFGTKILGIPKELNAKGLPTQWLHTFDVNNNLRCLYSGNYPNSETQTLRDLSYRLDAHDMPVEF